MGLDKTGFTLLDNEFKKRKQQLREQYQRKKATEVSKQAQNLFSTGKQREQDYKNIESNYDKTHFSDGFENLVKAQEKRIFNDWGGTRESAMKTMSGYQNESKADKAGKEEFKSRIKNEFNQRKQRGRDHDHGS